MAYIAKNVHLIAGNLIRKGFNINDYDTQKMKGLHSQVFSTLE